MNDTMYRPPKKLWPWIAPTEIDGNLRNRLVQGEVHDENAFAMGGVSGHAGVFSTAPDLAAFCQMLLNGGVYAHQRILKRATIAQFTAPQQLSNGARTLGWAVPTEGSSSGHYFLGAQLRPHRIHRHLDLDRSGPPAFCGAADQPRAPDARKPEDRAGPACLS